jgi:hypothetical protein
MLITIGTLQHQLEFFQVEPTLLVVVEVLEQIFNSKAVHQVLEELAAEVVLIQQAPLVQELPILAVAVAVDHIKAAPMEQAVLVDLA